MVALNERGEVPEQDNASRRALAGPSSYLKSMRVSWT